jgi:uncharacterized protein (TIGR02266 family)
MVPEGREREQEMSENMVAEHRGEATIVQLSEAPGVDNRRQHPRFAVQLEVGITSEHNFYAGFTENLSRGGVFVATHQLKPVGSSIELTITLPGSETPIRAKGEVRWLRSYNEQSDAPPGMGVRFLEVDPQALAAIDAFLRQREPLFFDDD